jgi:RimJ/RimL family protein N-acetyltransferase
MKRIIWHQPERIMLFVAERTGEESYGRDYTALGLEQDGKLVAGVLFTNYTKAAILMHVASDGSRHWMTPAFLAAAFRYPFIQLGCRRVTGLVRLDNEAAMHFDEHLGFRREGVLREGATDGCDMVIYGMLRNECRFLGERLRAALERIS